VAAACGGRSLRHLADSKLTRGGASGDRWRPPTAWARRLDGLVARAQAQLFRAVFLEAVCGGSRALFRALKALRVDGFARLRSRRPVPLLLAAAAAGAGGVAAGGGGASGGASGGGELQLDTSLAAALHRQLLARDPSLATLRLFRPAAGAAGAGAGACAGPGVDRGVTLERLLWMIGVCDAMHAECGWAAFFDRQGLGDSDDEDEGEGEGEEEDDSAGQGGGGGWESDPGWHTGPGAPSVGLEVRWVLEDSASGLWSEGRVVAHAPPAEPGDVELWKVAAPAPGAGRGGVLFFDLERHELDAARARVPPPQ